MSYEPWTFADQQEVQRDINGYLEEHDIPPQPIGFRWFVPLPDEQMAKDQLWQTVTGELLRFGPVEISADDEIFALRKVLTQLYGA
ncbi:MAG TPA: DUF5956 family protein [Actinophytocola sp.]|nr:DUF5956 family protein [Actinophytocola sp.]